MSRFLKGFSIKQYPKHTFVAKGVYLISQKLVPEKGGGKESQRHVAKKGREERERERDPNIWRPGKVRET